jgi:hypothetical protein
MGASRISQEGCRASSVVDHGSSVVCSRRAAMEMGAELDPLDASARCTHRLKRQHGRDSSGVPAPRAARSSRVCAGPLEVSTATGIELFWNIAIANAQKQS